MRPSFRFLIVSGPTREPLDPVRYISNYSTGTMGKYLVDVANSRGHKVEWVECPTRVETAMELSALLKKLLPKCDILVMAAAVADVRPVKFFTTKIKKDSLTSIPVVKNPDVLKQLSKIKKKSQIFVGFALESQNMVQNAENKMKDKKMDLVLLQQVTEKNKPFGNKLIDATLLGPKGVVEEFSRADKKKIALSIIQNAENACDLKSGD